MGRSSMVRGSCCYKGCTNNLKYDNVGPMNAKESAEYGSLTVRGKRFYDDARNEGADHDTAFRDAKHSYGVKS